MKSDLKLELKDLSRKIGLDYFGVCSADSLAGLPDTHKPTDFLPTAKSIVVLGIKIPRSAELAHKQVFKGEPRREIFSYVRYGVKQTNENLDTAAFTMLSYIEKKGFIAYALPASEPKDEETFTAAFPHRYAAVAAGLAQFGWQGLAVTPEDGPRVRWISIITDAMLEPDPKMVGKKLCDHSKCSVCVEVCPVGALSEKEKVVVDMGDYKDEYAVRDKARCRCAITGLVKGTPGRLQADMPEELHTMSEYSALNKTNDPWQRVEFMHGNYCNRCLFLCPIGEKVKG